MKSMIGIIKLTFLELRSNWIILGLFIISTLIWILMALALNLDVVDGSLTAARVFGNDLNPTSENSGPLPDGLDIANIVVTAQQFIGGVAYWVGILLALFATASLIATMQDKGSIDLLLSKPISRNAILSGRLLGVFLSMSLLLTYLIGAVWIVIGIKTGVWNPKFLLSIPLILLMFMVMYSVITMISILIPSTALSLIVTYGLIFASIFLSAKTHLAPQINLPWRNLYLGLYHVLPNFAEVTKHVAQLAGKDPVDSLYPIVSSVLFACGAYGIAFWRFNRKDY